MNVMRDGQYGSYRHLPHLSGISSELLYGRFNASIYCLLRSLHPITVLILLHNFVDLCGIHVCNRCSSDPSLTVKDAKHAFVNVLTRGDLSSLTWIESPLKYFDETKQRASRQLCNVYYTSLNFRDIMLATGKLPPDAIPGL